ncbi:MAG: SCP2 sterol-binding domain-containing protein [Pseudomonadota bacterium]
MPNSSDPTVDQIIHAMPSRFNPEAAADVDAVIQFHLSGDDGGDYHATLRDGACAVGTGSHPQPTLTLRMSAQTYVDMVMDRTTGQAAFFARKLRFDGPISLVIRLHRFFTL